MKPTILSSLLLALTASTTFANPLPEPVSESASIVPIVPIKQTSRDEILKRQAEKASKTSNRRDTGSVLPYPNCNPNQGSTDGLTAFATYFEYEPSGSNIGYVADYRTLEQCQSACLAKTGCDAVYYRAFDDEYFGFSSDCTFFSGYVSLSESNDRLYSSLRMTCAEAVEDGRPTDCCNTFVSAPAP